MQAQNEVIELLRKNVVFWDNEGEGPIAQMPRADYDQALAKLKEEPEHGWISVSERLPEEGTYLVLYDDSEQRFIYEADFIDKKWYSMTGHGISFVTYWMPIILPG